MPKIIKQLCCGLLWLLLLAPALQAKWQWIPVPALNGVYELAPKAEFSVEALFANRFQPALESYLEDRIGFRSWLIQLRNQLGYSVFNESWANHIAVGRDHRLFPPEDLDAYVGTDYVGDEQIQFDARRARAVQDTLARHGVQLVYVLAPGKADFMPEYMPWNYRHRVPTRSNYRAYAEALPAAGVHVVDMAQAFRQWKVASPYPLFTPGGMHWSTYGAARAADSLQRYLRQTLHVAAAPFQLSAPEITTTARDSDDDLAKTLNLIAADPPGKLAYPKLEFDPIPPTQAKPNILLIGDSFGWPIVNSQFLTGSFSPQSRYWYYNSEVAWPGPELTPEGRDIQQQKNRGQYLSRDVIMVLFYTRNLHTFDKGFSQEVFRLFTPYTAANTTRREALLQKMRAKASWEESTKPDFEQHLADTVNLLMDRERLMGRAKAAL